MRKRVLLLIPTTSYRTQAFVDAAHRLNVDLTVASEHPNVFQEKHPRGLLTISYSFPQEAVHAVIEFAKENPISSVVGVDDQSVVLASILSEALSLPHNSVDSVSATRNKVLMRECLARASVPQPRYTLLSLDENIPAVASQVNYPCVLKPLALAGSRGVIRVNNESEFIRSAERIKRILCLPEVAPMCQGGEANTILVEEYIPGTEIAIEGILSHGHLQVLAVFDKPDSLEGPFFEETIYVTPSRLSKDVIEEVARCTETAIRAMGLVRGPIHAELRLNEKGPFIVEIAARSIGGFCARSLRFVEGADPSKIISLEEIILRNALERDIQTCSREYSASGVMMIPIPRPGLLKDVSGIERARAVSHITDVIISAHKGEEVIPLPEGGKYLGFIFSRAEKHEEVEAALREAHRRLEFDIAGNELTGLSIA